LKHICVFYLGENLRPMTHLFP